MEQRPPAAACLHERILSGMWGIWGGRLSWRYRRSAPGTSVNRHQSGAGCGQGSPSHPHPCEKGRGHTGELDLSTKQIMCIRCKILRIGTTPGSVRNPWAIRHPLGATRAYSSGHRWRMPTLQQVWLRYNDRRDTQRFE